LAAIPNRRAETASGKAVNTNQPTIDEAFDTAMQNLATTLRPSSIASYRYTLNGFRTYLHATFPEIKYFSQLRRTPHIVGWLRTLHEHKPPLANSTRAIHIIMVRSVLNDLAINSKRPLKEPLFLRGDVPPHDLCLPKPLSLEDDLRLQEQLRKKDDLCANAFLLMRATGIRIGESRVLRTDSLRHLGGSDWALHVSVGKLHNERWVPVDSQGRDFFARILQLRVPQHGHPETSGLLLRMNNGKPPSYFAMSHALLQAAQLSGCSGRVSPHRLRHTYATSLLRAGVNIFAIQKLLGHRSIVMTMRYVQVTQVDLQREYHQARQRMAPVYSIPKIKEPASGISGINQVIAQAKHLIEMYRRGLDNKNIQLTLHRLTQRLAKISANLKSLDPAPK
jgi:site-specific recombinase XerD